MGFDIDDLSSGPADAETSRRPAGGNGAPASETGSGSDQEQAPPESDTSPEGEVSSEKTEEKLREENEFLLSQLQRARAELENFRRRTSEERHLQRHRVTAEIFREILRLHDDLELAVRSEEDGDQLREGLRIIVDKFEQLLADHGIEAIAAVGQPFDPTWHEAMFHVETDDRPEGEVLDELERGYRIGDSLIRPARVTVAKIASPPEEAEPSSNEEEG